MDDSQPAGARISHESEKRVNNLRAASVGPLHQGVFRMQRGRPSPPVALSPEEHATLAAWPWKPQGPGNEEGTETQTSEAPG